MGILAPVLMNPAPWKDSGVGCCQEEPVPSAARASGCGGGGLDSVTELGSEVTEVGGSWMERQRETESPHASPEGQTRGRNGAETRGSLVCSSVGPWRGLFPSLPDSQARAGAPGAQGGGGGGSCSRLGQAGSACMAPGRQTGEGWPSMTGPPSPALSPWGRGVCGGPPRTGPGPRCCGLPASVTSSSSPSL